MFLHKRKKTYYSRGFTLVEMLVVLILVATLAAMATPIYSEYREQGYRNEGVAVLFAILSAAKVYYYRNGNSFINSDCNCSRTNNIWLNTAEICRNWAINYNPSNTSVTITASGARGEYSGINLTLVFDAITGITSINGQEM